MKNNKIIIDKAYGNITKVNSKDTVFLLGEYIDENSNYIENLEVVIKKETGEYLSTKFPYEGYRMQLFVGDFTGDGKSEVMVRGGFGGTGGFEIGVIYTYDYGGLYEIFNQDEFYKNYPCNAKYKDNYKVSIDCNKSKYLIDISKQSQEYLSYIYNEDKEVITDDSPYVDRPSGIYPIKEVYNDYYQLLIKQRVVGEANADTIAIIQTGIQLLDNTSNIVYRGILIS